ncbi:hypothetical protein [Actinomadura rugatobispora]|uniref:Uncharacterized protein n=1 Tax=Actinomadura rugatobispora TaxID=1994 RepID=A0ABW1ABI9_9ACTN|nr:hypothetical protein GCM10010200_061220 [Actinomadura rugatobispora]
MPVLAIPLNDDTVTPGFLGFGVFLALLIATIFLIRSMNKQIGKIQAPREADLKQQAWERAQAAQDEAADREPEATPEVTSASPSGKDDKPSG